MTFRDPRFPIRKKLYSELDNVEISRTRHVGMSYTWLRRQMNGRQARPKDQAATFTLIR